MDEIRFHREVSMIRTRPIARVAFLFLPLLLSAEGEIQPAVPRIEWTDLQAPIVEKSPDFKTGYLVVPERRFPAPTGRTIRLPFIVMKSRSSSPRPDPVFFMTGGPGGSTMFRAGFFRRSPLLDDRDVILLEQRGNRFAEPALMCPEIDRALRSGWGSRLNGDPDPQAVTAALAAAARSLEEAGIDLAGYTTKESAADIADLRRLLELASWNLYGVSYSTKLMLTVLRDHPQGVRAAILDSVLPLEANCDEETPANILEALDRIFALWPEDERLRTRFPELRERFYRLLAEANRRPLEITLKDPLDGKPLSLRIDGVGVMNCIYTGLEDTSTIPHLPLIIDAACRGESGRLAPLAQAYLSSPQGTAWGMRLAVWCNEELPFARLEKILKPAGMPPELARFIQPQVPLEALRSWPQGQPDARENEPVRSRVPILIAAGEFDPDTPTKWARRTASFLPNAHLMEFAGYSHVPLFRHPEAARIMREFLADPSRRPDQGKTAVRPAFLLSWDEKTLNEQ
jgi:pimeloyl-ACP methyl ester carboxylesterase